MNATGTLPPQQRLIRLLNRFWFWLGLPEILGGRSDEVQIEVVPGSEEDGFPLYRLTSKALRARQKTAGF